MKKRWKSLIAWVLIITIIGGYGNTALAAGLGDGISSGTENGTGPKAGISADAGTGSQGEAGENSSSGEENKETGGSTGETGGAGETGTENGSTGGTGTETGGTGDMGSAGENGTEGGNAGDEGEEVSQEPADTIETEGLLETEEGLEAAALAAQAGTYAPYWENGNYSNLVVLVDFADSTHDHSGKVFGQCFKEDPADTFKYFNGDEDNPRGMRQYLYNISYGQLRVENIFPQYNQAENTITPYTLSHEASYYVDNEAAMVTEVIEQLEASGQIQENMNLHLSDPTYNIVDNLNIVVAGDSSNLFIDHKTTYGGDKKVAGCLVRNYTVVKENDVYLGYSGSGVIIHEFLHSLGYPDTYRQGSGIPIGSWDIMSTVSERVQYPLAYLRSAYTKWFKIPSITESQTGISLYAASKTTAETKDQQALILKTDYSDTEFFVVEYRKKGEQYENGQYSNGYEVGIPGSGLIVYRVNTSQETNYVGKTDLLYLFRPGDSYGDDGRELGQGNYDEAHLSQEVKRTSYGSSNFKDSLAEGAITYSDGKNSGIVISNVGSAAGDQITFDVTFHEEEEGASWKTVAAEKEGEITSKAASCMDKEGNLYFILEKGSASYLYQCRDGSFTRLGAAPSGNTHKLAWYNGQLYSAYLDSQYVAKLALWNGSYWQDLYRASRETNSNNFSVTSDSKGVYLAYASTDGTGVYAVSYTAAGVAELGGQVAASTGYAANASIAAENGTIVVMYREVFNNNRICVKQYNSSTENWSDVGSQNFCANSGIIKIHSGKVYLMKNGSTFGENKAYLYVYDLRNGGSWQQVGSNTYADASIAEMDLCFAGGEPYVVYMSGSETRVTEVKRLVDNAWTNLGDSVARETVAGLFSYSFDGQIYVAYLNTVTGKVSVKTHASESTGVEDGLLLSPEFAEVEGKNPFQVISELRDSENEIAAFSQGIYEDSFQNQLEDIQARELYELLVEQYVTKRLAGPQTVTLKTPVTFQAHVEDGYLVPDASEQGLAKLAGSFHLAYGAFYMDHPSVFWMQGLGYSIGAGNYSYVNNGTGGCTVTVSSISLITKEYYPGASNQVASFDEAVKKAKEEIESGLSESERYDQVKAIHDYLCDRLEYDYAAAENLNASAYGYAHTSSTAFLGYNGRKSVVCEGYAKAFKVLCDQWGIPCVLVIGKGGNPGAGEPHMWNYVQMEDGNWYGVDVTWDDQTSGIRSEYFLAGSGTPGFGRYSFLEEHRPDMYITTGGEYPFVYPELAGEGYVHACWRLEYGYTESSDGTVLFFDSQKDILTALDKLNISQTNIRISSEEKEQPTKISADLLSLCAEKNLGLEFVRKEEETQTVYTWNFQGLSKELEKEFEDFDLGIQIAGEGISVLDEILSNGYLQISSTGKTPYCDNALLKIERKGITDSFAGVTILNQWRQKGETLSYFQRADFDRAGNWVQIALETGNEGIYVLSGDFQYGWAEITEGGGSHVVYIENQAGERLKGWQVIDGVRYYFDPHGYLCQGPAKIEGNWYLFGDYEAGKQGILFGYKQYKDSWYYTDTNGILQKGWQKIGEIWHYFNPDTYAERESEQNGYWVTLKDTGNRYYFYWNTWLLTGWQAIDGATYFLEADGSAKTGWFLYGPYWYYFDADGRMQTDYVEVIENGVKEHYFLAYNGIRQTGWQRDAKGVWHYFDVQNGKEVTSTHLGGYWYEMEGARYYFNGNNWLTTGFLYIDGEWYCFDPYGKMYQGTQWIGGGSYHFREDGTLGIGLFTDEGETYYAAASGVLYHGWQKIDGVWRFFDQQTGAEKPCTISSDYWGYVDGVRSYYFISGYWLATGFQTIEDKVYYFSGTGELQTGFFQVGAYTYYGEKDGNDRGALALGSREIDGGNYYFAPGYIMCTGWQQIEGKWCYFDTDPEHLGRQKPVTALGNWWYEVEGKRYYLLYDYYPLYGFQNINGVIYYFDPATGAMAQGEQQIGGYYYYFDAEGKMQADTIVEDYGYAASGVRVSGWQYIRGSWHYFDPVTYKHQETTSLGDNWYQVGNDKYYFIYGWYLATGFQYINGHYYYFNPQTGALKTGILEQGISWSYLGEDGTLQYGWIETEQGRYYANGGGVLLSGWHKIEGLWYYFNPETRLLDENAYVADDYFAYAGGNTYYLYEGYYPVTGWAYIQDNWRYFDPATGIMQTGFLQIGGISYYLDENGIPLTGWQTYEGNRYYCVAYGQVLTGFQYLDGNYYYFNAAGVMQRYWQQIGAYRYYFGSDGKMRTGFVNSFGTTYYCYGSGVMATGLQWIDGAYYYFNMDGSMQTGWQNIGGYRYYFQKDKQGAMAVGLLEIDGENYYFSSSPYGVLMTGWQWLDNRYRFFDLKTGQEVEVKIGTDYWGSVGDQRCYFVNGVTPVSGFQYIHGAYYYFDAYGFMQTGSFSVNGYWYQSKENGALCLNEFYKDPATGNTYYYNSGLWRVSGWNAINGYWYYFDGAGVMQSGFTDIYGYKYYLGEKGKDTEGRLQLGAIYVDGKLTYYSGGAWELQSGWQYINGAWEYFDTVTKERVETAKDPARPNWITMEGKEYYFINGWSLATGFQYIDGKYYYFDGTGALQKGSFNVGGYWYRTEEEDSGALLLSSFYTELGTGNVYYYGSGLNRVSGWNAIGGYWYYFDASGVMQTGFTDINGYKYYLGEKGTPETGQLQVGAIYIDGKLTYYSGGAWELQSGWQFINGVWNYFDTVTKERVETENDKDNPYWITMEGKRYYFIYGWYLATGFQYIDGYYYYFDASGAMQTGDYVVGQTWYRSNEDGTLFTGSYSLDGKDYYYSNGQRYTGGFIVLDGKKYFYNANGEKLYGKVWLGGVYYYFDLVTGALQTGLFEVTEKNGEKASYYTSVYEYLQSGWQYINGAWSYFDTATKKQIKTETNPDHPNWVTMEKKEYYFIAGWYLATGFQYIDGHYYYFDGTGALQKGSFSVGGYWYQTEAEDSGVLLLNSFYTDRETGNTYYYGAGLNRVTGWNPINGYWYYFDALGVMQTGFTDINGYKYYFREKETLEEGVLKEAPEAGRLQLGAIYIDNQLTYYSGGTWELQSGWQYIDGKWEYFDTVTKERVETEPDSDDSNWIIMKGKEYYFIAGWYLATGFQYIDGYYYYFDGTGVLQKGSFSVGGYWYQTEDKGSGRLLLNSFYTANGNTYYYGGGLYRMTGWNPINGYWYYFDASGVMQTGFTDINGYKYYFGEEGTEEKGRLQLGAIYIDGELTYYSGGAWELQSGWQNINGTWYYFASDTKKSIPIEREGDWVTMEGDKYYFIYGWYLATGFQYIDGSWYYFDGTGKLQKGWFAIGDARYYMDPDTGKAYTGFKDFGNKTYYFNVMGGMHTGWLSINTGEEAGTYYFNTMGSISRGITYIGNTRYLFDTNGKLVTTQTVLEDGITYYATVYGTLRSGLLWEEGGYHYYLDGRPQCGMQNIGGYYYYFDSGTGSMHTGWVTLEEDGETKSYWFGPNGVRVSGWQFIDQKWEFFDWTTGESRELTPAEDLGIGWYRMDGKEYYFISNWYLATGWQWIGSDMYYFDSTGALKKGWFDAGGARCYSAPQTGKLANGLKRIGRDTYYFNIYGMAQEGMQYINGWRYFKDYRMQTGFAQVGNVTYYFDGNGLMQTGIIRVRDENGAIQEYYMASSGVLQKGWRYVNGAWTYYSNQDGRRMQAELVPTEELKESLGPWCQWYKVTEDGKENWYCIYANAYALTGLVTLGSYRYYFDANGVLHKGYFEAGGVPYYADEENGAIPLSGILYQDKETGDIFFYNTYGQMHKGWLYFQNQSYYFNYATGAAYRSGWYYVDNQLYLFSPMGAVQYQPYLTGLYNINYQTAEATWNPAPEAEDYRVEVALSADFSDAQEFVYEKDAVKGQLADLQEGVTYYVRFRYRMAGEVLHTVEGKNEEELFSTYSPVYTIVVQGETPATYSSAAIQQCEVVADSNASTGYGVAMAADVYGRLMSDDASYYVVHTDTYYGVPLGEPLYEFSKNDGVKSEDGRSYRFTFTIPINDLEEGVMNKYALAVKWGGSYQLISPGSFVANPEFVAENTSEYFMPDSKKGIQSAVWAEDSGTKNVTMNLELSHVLRYSDVPYEYKGNTYYFGSLGSEVATVKEFNSGATGNKIQVSMIILLDYHWSTKDLIIPSARVRGAAPYYMLDTTSQASQEKLEALFCYLGEVFGKEDCYVSNWILGNEVNSCNAWNYNGGIDFGSYIKGYANAFRTLYYGVKKTCASSRVFISLDNAWNQPVAGYTSKAVLDTFVSYICAENPDIDWNVALHPYSAPLTRTDFWNDYSNTTDGYGTRFISMRNIHVLTSYVAYLESAYGKEPDSIRVILSEQGWTSSLGYGEYNQAFAIAFGYYIAEFNDRIDAFIIRAEIDDWAEEQMGLAMGLKYRDESKKLAYYVYKYMDTPRVTSANPSPSQWAFKDYVAEQLIWNGNDANKERFKTAQSLLLNTNWSGLVTGYNEAKLNKMPYGYKEDWKPGYKPSGE